MHAFVRTIFVALLHLGPFGLLILGVLDSSFLFLPLGNDLLLIALTVRRHTLLPLYVAMATAGSVLGCYLLDLVFRNRGEAGLKRILSPKRVKYVEARVKESRREGAVGCYAGSAALPVYRGDCRRLRDGLSAEKNADRHRNGTF